MAKELSTRISLRKDSLQNWTASNPVLNNGEMAIVINEDGSENIKLGNGISAFSQLPYLYQTELKSDKVTTKAITAKSISQGYNVSSTPTSLATGVFSKAEGQFGVVHGIEAKVLSTDNYAFVFNGENLPLDGESFYTSHGEGSFSVNPLGGLSGFYVGERSLCAILSDYLTEHQSLSSIYKKSETSSSTELATEFSKYEPISDLTASYYTKSETSSASDLCAAFKAHEDHVLSSVQISGSTMVFYFNKDIKPLSISLSAFVDNYSSDISALSNAISTIGSDYLDSYDKIDILNRCIERDEIKFYYGPEKKQVSLSIFTGEGEALVQTVTLSDFYAKNETSSASEISTALKNIDLSEYYKRSETSSATEISSAFKESLTKIVTWTKIEEAT